MSQTVPVDVVTRSYWAYVASAMVNGLAQILDSQVAPTVAIPRRVYVDAHQFFKIALEAAGDVVPNNPSASIANYIIAADAAKVVVQSEADRAQLQTRLLQYATLLNKLENGAAPLQGELETARQLKEFFAQVQHEAEVEAYERVVRSQPPPAGFRMR
jgi:hypothetical protein